MARRPIRRVLLTTAACIAGSFGMSLLALKIFYAINPSFTLTASEFQAFVLSLSIAMPLIICPIAAYRSSRAIENLSDSRDAFAALSKTDELTGLLNRRGFDAAARAAMENEKAAGRSTAVLTCDIDRFKALNDEFGHGIGDRALVRVAAILSAVAEPRGMLAGRQGGDEFVMMLPRATLAEAADIAEAIRLACAEIVFEGPAGSSRLSVSLGVAVCPRSETPLSNLLRRADVALYDVKRSGRNRVVAANVEERWSHAA
jgi:diguanylate cyclase (GGDEF)-like protein